MQRLWKIDSQKLHLLWQILQPQCFHCQYSFVHKDPVEWHLRKNFFWEIILKKIFKVVMKLFYKYGMIYREVLHSPSIDWCHLTTGKQENIMVDQVVTLLNTSAPGAVHACPYTVRNLESCCQWPKIVTFQELQVINATVAASTLLSVFPSGDYKFILYLAHANESLAVINIIGTMNSLLKENFG